MTITHTNTLKCKCKWTEFRLKLEFICCFFSWRVHMFNSFILKCRQCERDFAIWSWHWRNKITMHTTFYLTNKLSFLPLRMSIFNEQKIVVTLFLSKFYSLANENNNEPIHDLDLCKSGMTKKRWGKTLNVAVFVFSWWMFIKNLQIANQIRIVWPRLRLLTSAVVVFCFCLMNLFWFFELLFHSVFDGPKHQVYEFDIRILLIYHGLWMFPLVCFCGLTCRNPTRILYGKFWSEQTLFHKCERVTWNANWR